MNFRFDDDSFRKNDERFSAQRPGLNVLRSNQQNKRITFHPSKIVFKSNLNQEGRIHDDHNKRLSQASLSSDSQSASGSVLRQKRKSYENLPALKSLRSESQKQSREESPNHRNNSPMLVRKMSRNSPEVI